MWEVLSVLAPAYGSVVALDNLPPALQQLAIAGTMPTGDFVELPFLSQVGILEGGTLAAHQR